MSKKVRKSRKKQTKWLEYLFIGLVVALVAMLIVRAFLPENTTNSSDGWVITEDGHIHTTAGEHISTYEEMFGMPWEGFATPTDLTEGEVPADEAAPTAEPAA